MKPSDDMQPGTSPDAQFTDEPDIELVQRESVDVDVTKSSVDDVSYVFGEDAEDTRTSHSYLLLILILVLLLGALWIVSR